MTLQQYVESADLLLTATFITGCLAIILVAACLFIFAIAVIIYFRTTEYLGKSLGGKSK